MPIRRVESQAGIVKVRLRVGGLAGDCAVTDEEIASVTTSAATRTFLDFIVRHLSNPPRLTISLMYLPSIANALVLELGLFFRFFQRLMPCVRNRPPLVIAAEKEIRTIPGVLTDSQSRHRPLEDACNDLSAVAGMTVPVVNRRIADDFRRPDFSWGRFHTPNSM